MTAQAAGKISVAARTCFDMTGLVAVVVVVVVVVVVTGDAECPRIWPESCFGSWQAKAGTSVPLAGCTKVESLRCAEGGRLLCAGPIVVRPGEKRRVLFALCIDRGIGSVPGGLKAATLWPTVWCLEHRDSANMGSSQPQKEHPPLALRASFRFMSVDLANHTAESG